VRSTRNGDAQTTIARHLQWRCLLAHEVKIVGAFDVVIGLYRAQVACLDESSPCASAPPTARNILQASGI